jgi:hypothetical protein
MRPDAPTPDTTPADTAAAVPLHYARPGAGTPQRHAGASPSRQFLVLLLLAAGVQAWILFGRAQLGEKRQLLACVLAAVAAIVAWQLRPIREKLTTASALLRGPSPRQKLLTALVITLAACAYLYATARLQQRDFSPILHDEYAYAIQAKIVAAGKLWLPRHDVAESFDTFHLITDRAYAPKYGPGTALVLAPAALLGLPTWLTPLLLSGLAVGLIYLLATELFDDATAGLLAALLLLSLGIFRRTSVMVMSQSPMLVLALVAMLAYLHWRRTHRLRAVALLGVCVGWGALTRPLDAVALALPIALAVLLDLRPLPGRDRGRVIAAGLLAVAPFLLLQLVYNKGLTGKLTALPWDYYARTQDPYDTMSRRPIDPTAVPALSLPQKRTFQAEFTRPAFERAVGQRTGERAHDRLSRLLAGPPLEEQEKTRLIYGALPTPLLIPLLPVGLLALHHRRWALWLGLPILLAVYTHYPYFFSHYAVAMTPAVILTLLAAREVLPTTWPRAASPIRLVLTTTLAASALLALPELNRARRDQWFDAPLLRQIDRDLATISRPALVLFTYDPDRLVHEEPVYNTQSAHPDDAPIIRAHDLGPEQNARLLAYYAAKSPDRAVYRYDEAKAATGDALQYLGTARELAPK